MTRIFGGNGTDIFKVVRFRNYFHVAGAAGQHLHEEPNTSK